jgi:hypothetical protein
MFNARRIKEALAFDFAMFLKTQNKPEIKRKTQIQTKPLLCDAANT